MSLKEVKIKKGMTKIEINNLISSWIELLDDEYLGNSHPHNWKCQCGEIIEGRQWANIRFRNDTKCVRCVKQEIIDKYKSKVNNVDGYEFLNAYFVGDILPCGKKVERFPYIQVKHNYCNSIYTIRVNNFINEKQCCSKCCGAYENSLAYFIEVTLGKSLEYYIDINKTDIKKHETNPYFLNKSTLQKLWFLCKKNPHHKSSYKSCADFVSGIKNNSGCLYCRNNDTHELDSIAYKYPQLAAMIVGDVDTSTLAPQSNERYHIKCLECGHISKHKVQICNLVNQGYSCKVCGDGVSIPEKFMYNILLDLGVDFLNRKKFDWSDNKEYDFYIPSLNIIIETHGGQHYSDRISFNSTDLKKQQKNDEYKFDLATKIIPKENYFVVDCRISDFDYLKNNIKSTLENVFDFSNVDWNLAWKNSQKSLVIKTWDLWNSGTRNSAAIADKLKLSRSTIIRYLKNGSELGYCDYDPKEEMKKSAKKNACNNKELHFVSPDGCVKPFPSIISLQEELNISRRTYNNIMKNKGVIDVNLFTHKRIASALSKYNGYRIIILS